MTALSTKEKLAWYNDFLIFLIIAVLAGCGLVYEYLLSHYAGRILGALESTIYAIIGIMIVAMGIGALLARKITDPFTGFAWLESVIALFGSSSVLLIAFANAYTSILPHIIAQHYDLPGDISPSGGWINTLQNTVTYLPFFFALLLGLAIGMEIPLMARIRATLYQKYLEHNPGDIYGVDYIGAGIGAACWVLFMLKLDIHLSAAFTASANLAIGLLFIYLFYKKIRYLPLLLILHSFIAILLYFIFQYGQNWVYSMEDMLYRDHVIYSLNTPYQHITVTERIIARNKPAEIAFFINGRTQFTSSDEKIYHSMLVYPAMLASARHDNILVIGGGDGLAVREILRWNPKKVTLLDLDKDIIDFFSYPKTYHGDIINQRLLNLNQHSLTDPRVQISIGDAFINVDQLLEENKHFDTIIVDLPDPGHPDLNKLYSSQFYAKLKHLLYADGAMVVQSTSPYHAKNAFLSIGKTLLHAQLSHVQQYHYNVPSFGEWGWSLATKNAPSAKARIQAFTELPISDHWITQGIILAAFEFSQHYFDVLPHIKINRLGSYTIYNYHHKAWKEEQIEY